MELTIGQLVQLKQDCMGNRTGTKGIVYESQAAGKGIIFQNGNYDLFDTAEQKSLLIPLQIIPQFTVYGFCGFKQLEADYKNGHFDIALNIINKPNLTIIRDEELPNANGDIKTSP